MLQLPHSTHPTYTPIYPPTFSLPAQATSGDKEAGGVEGTAGGDEGFPPPAASQSCATTVLDGRVLIGWCKIATAPSFGDISDPKDSLADRRSSCTEDSASSGGRGVVGDVPDSLLLPLG